VLAAIVLLAGCGHRRERVLEEAYVSAPQVALRDQLATAFTRVGMVKNGERVEVLEHEKHFARVRTATGIEGWIEQRNLIDQKTYDVLQQLTRDNQNDPVQAPGVLRNETNLHVTPGRETEHLYQLASGAKVAILKRTSVEKDVKQTGAKPPTPAVAVSPHSRGSRNAKIPEGPVMEDWWLVRDEGGRVGWVLARMVDVDVPLDIAQYAEGQRFVAFFVLNQVSDGDKKVPEYICLLTEPHDGLPYDFDQVRVFTWNVRKHRYETAYREHGLNGALPVTVAQENFDKEGTLPVFVLHVKDDAGAVSERKYKLNTPMVRRVLPAGELKGPSSRQRH
jgi:SH3-like domain-containing protein